MVGVAVVTLLVVATAVAVDFAVAAAVDVAKRPA